MTYMLPPVPYINVSSNMDQYTNPINTPIPVTYTTVDNNYGVELFNNSRITVKSAGKYLITFSAVVDASQGKHLLNMWIRKNGLTPITNSNTLTTAESGTPAVCTVTIILNLIANDYFEIMMQFDALAARISHVAASGVIPVSPSIILTCNKVSDQSIPYIMQ